MVAVALLPLAAFAALAAFELDSVSRGTAVAAQGAILQDEQARQQGSVAAAAGLIDERMDQIDADLGQVVAQLRQAIAAAAPTVPAGLTVDGTSGYAGGPGSPSSLELPLPPSESDLRLVDGATGLSQLFGSLHHDYPEITNVWAGNSLDSTLRIAPGVTLVPPPKAGHDVTDPDQNRGQIIAAARPAFEAHLSAWTDPQGVTHAGGPYWTDPYQLLGSTEMGVSGWLPVAGGSDVVGVDVSLRQLVGSALSSVAATPSPAGAYSVLLSTSGTAVWGGPALGLDFSLPADPTGSPLPPPANNGLRAQLAHLEAYGGPPMIRATLGGVTKDVFAAPVYAARWVMLRPVPIAALEPDLASLTHGIAAGVHQLFPLVVLPALLLLLVLAFFAATLLSRRLVGPVRRLTVAAAALAGGDTERPMPQQGSDEVGVLAATLERMRVETNSQREQILSAAAELEGRVEERTNELRARNDELVALNAL